MVKPIDTRELRQSLDRGGAPVRCGTDGSAARKIALRYWPNGAMTGTMLVELPRPTEFDQVAALVREEDVADVVVCGNDVERHLSAIARFASAGYDTVYLHQVGPDQAAFFRFHRDDVLPRLADGAPT